MRVLWLPAVLRAAGLTVHEVSGWRTRGNDSFGPVRGITCHHTAGSRTSTVSGEINTLLHGSNSAPAPIAQLFLARNGDWYVVASGLCYHNKQGWAGPNEGYGNDNLLGIEAQHSGGSEPWTDEQYGSYVRGVAALVKHDAPGWDVSVSRVAGHKEHQPGAKSDPTFNMDTFRARVLGQIRDGDDDMATITQEDFNARMDAWWNARMSPSAKDNPQRAALRVAPWQQTVGATDRSTHNVLFGDMYALLQQASADDTDEATIAKLVLAGLGGPDSDPQQLAAALRTVLGDAAPEVGRILASA